MITQALVPVAGLGTRLLPISRAIPKELLPVGRKPTLQWIAEELAATGVNRICLVTSPSKSNIDQLFRPDAELETRLSEKGEHELLSSLWSQGPYTGTELLVATQDQQLGLGHAVACGQPSMRREPFVVALGDCLMTPVGSCQLLQRLIDVFESESADAVIAFEQVSRERVSRYGIADPMNDGPVFQLRDVIEKPSLESAPSQLAIAARYVLSYDVFAAIDRIEPGQGGELQLTDALRLMIHDGKRIFGVQLFETEHRVDIGNYESWARAFIDHALMDESLEQDILKRIRHAR